LDLNEKAKDLGREIRKTDAYQELERAGENLKQDDQAQQLVQQVQEVQRQMEFSQQAGVQPDQQQMQQFAQLREQMQSNITVKAFMKAQEEFNNVMKEVNEAISEGVTGESEEGEEE